MTFGAVILAGGKSRRMGTPKQQLTLDGVRFIDRLAQELGGFHELLISVEDEKLHTRMPCPMVSDQYPDCGPMGGLHSALKSCVSDALLAVSCDIPLFSMAMAERLCACLDAETDAVITVTEDGRQHPLCGVYKKSCLPVLEQFLQEKNYRMRAALAKLRVKEYAVGAESWRLSNVNTPQDYARLCRHLCMAQKRQPVSRQNMIAICGWKNSGKTTLIEKLIPILTQKGVKVAVVKHDGHSYEPDVPGTDSSRFFQAGASACVIFDAEKYTLTRRVAIDGEEAPLLIPDADLILLEGFKWSSYPKIEMVCGENAGQPIPDLQGRIAYVSDKDGLKDSLRDGLPVFGRQDVRQIAEFVIQKMTGRKTNDHTAGS